MASLTAEDVLKEVLDEERGDCTAIHTDIIASSERSNAKKTSKRPVPKQAKRRTRMLTKSERMTTRKAIENLIVDDIIRKVEIYFQEEMTSRDLGLSTIIPLFLAKPNLLVTLVEYHRTIFIHLYEACSTTKEKFLQFQLEWRHTNCSVFLLSKDLSVKTISTRRQS